MSNKTQLQTNNTKVASLIETLRGKSLPTGGEDVTEETTAYTEKIASLETAITALETELQGKASGGSGGGGAMETCTVRMELSTGVFLSSYAAQIYDNGTVSTLVKYGSGAYGSSPIIIDNVIVGTAIMIEMISPIGNYSVQATNAQVLASGNYTIYVVSNTANDTAIIEFGPGGLGGGN